VQRDPADQWSSKISQISIDVETNATDELHGSYKIKDKNHM
jgi:hypothetical protein